MIAFVGDTPSAKNVDPNVPFVGTQSYKRLLEWIWMMDVDISEVSLFNRGDLIPFRDTTKVVALGNNASEWLGRVPHFKLPHPSGRNRKLNDEKYVRKVLQQCKKWLNG